MRPAKRRRTTYELTVKNLFVEADSDEDALQAVLEALTSGEGFISEHCEFALHRIDPNG